jgi:hypothetical protein
MRRFYLCTISSALVMASCGGQPVTCGSGTKLVGNQCVSFSALPDPILGAWIRTDYPSNYSCEFFGNGLWDNSCFIVDGFAVKWERIYEDRYVFAASYHSCDSTTEFAADAKSVTLTMFCGSTQPQSYTLSRIR